MNTYPKYKDSGEQWLGQIPEHWEMKRLAACFAKRSENWKRGETLELLSLLKDVGIVPYSEKGNIGNTAKTDFSQYKVARKGDLVINSMNVIIGSLGITPMDGYISPAYYAFAPREGVNTRYYNYILSLRRAQQNIRRFSKGIMEIRLKISANDFLSIQYPIPPIDEQEAMVAYLDEQTAQIDNAIAREQKMIDLLEERKQIIIQQAVTKGLNPNAKMKDSGIEWIGEIPEGWEVRKLKYIGDSKNGLTYSPLDMVDENQGILVLRSSNIQKGILSFEDNVYVKYAPKKLHVRKGDIIICSRNGSADLVGKCAIIDREMYATFGAFMMRFRSPHNDKYIYYLLSIAISKYKQLFATSTINQLTLGIFANMKVPIVLDELCQQTIVNYLDERLGNINRAIDAREKMIALLQERKQIIINEVVTGKIKVL